MFVLTVKIKDSDRKYSRDFTIYDTCTVSQDDPSIKASIEIAKNEFKINADDEPDIKFVIKCEVV